MSITAEDIKNAEVYLTSIQTEGISEAGLHMEIGELEYQGFDPRAFMARLQHIARTKAISDETHKKNLHTLAVLGTMRGGKINKIAQKSKGPTKVWLDKIVPVYGVKDGKPKYADDVTLLRIAACHAAPIALGIASGLPIRTTVQASNVAEGFPNFMCTSTFGSLIPEIEDTDFEILGRAYLYHQYLFDKIINPKKTSTKDVLQSYFRIQLQSNLYSQETKELICVKLDLIEVIDREYRLTN
ncbi:nucleocapsid protein, partial [Aphalara polygoni bunya-like virus]